MKCTLVLFFKVLTYYQRLLINFDIYKKQERHTVSKSTMLNVDTFTYVVIFFVNIHATCFDVKITFRNKYIIKAKIQIPP